MAGIILSADIGTSSLKAAFIDLDGKLLAFSRAPYRPLETAPNAASWERAFIRAVESLYAQRPACVPDGICVSGNGPTLVPLTADGESLPPLYWHDGRTVSPRAESPPPSFFLPRAAWLKKNAQAEYEKTQFFVSPHEWLSYRLGAEVFTVLPAASYEPYYWDDSQCRLFDLDRKKFPPFVKMGSIMGKVSAEAAGVFRAASGGCLKSGTPIIAAGPDFITALIGTGTLQPGDVCDRAGSSEGINVCALRPAAGDGLRTLPHVKEGLWNIGSLIPSSGSFFERYRNFTGQEERPYGEHLAELIPSADNTEVFSTIKFFPPAGKNPFAASHSPLEMGRSVLCAMAFAVRDAAENLRICGFPVSEMRVSGGQARNPRWNQLKADISGITLGIPEISDGELAGNAVLSAAALGDTSGLDRISARMIRIREVYKPRQEAAPFWDERYSLYCRQK